MTTRPVDPIADRDYILECHCRVNYACDTPWARDISYEQYRANWFAMPGQIEGFWSALLGSLDDPRCIAELMLDETGAVAGCLWTTFYEDPDNGFSFMDVQDLYIEERLRGQGLASQLMAYAEEKARALGAKVIRSGTGCENAASQAMHKKLGYYIYR